MRVKKKKLGAFSLPSMLFSMTLSLFVIGVFALLLVLSQNLTKQIQSNLEMQVFLERNASASDLTRIRNLLSDMDFVAKANGRALIEHIPGDVAAKEFAREIGEDFVAYIGENPLSDVLILRIAAPYHSENQFALIQKKIESLDGVLEVAYVKKLVERIQENIAKISILLVALSVLLLVSVVLIIHHSIRLAMFSQRFLIRSMQLVGATHRFIKRPFYARALGYALLAGGIATACLHLLMQVAEANIADIGQLASQREQQLIYAAIMGIGLVVSHASTRHAIRKYLRMSLDELY